MQVEFEIEINNVDASLLSNAIGCDEADLQTELAGHAKAALTEYIEAYLGRRAFNRGSDVLEYRLALLIQHALGGVVPDDARVSRLFQSTLSTSRTLLRNTLSKFRYSLELSMTASAKQLLEVVVWRETEYHARGASSNLIELLNQRLVVTDPTLKPVVKLTNSVATYAIAPSSYDELVTLYGANPVARP